MAERAVGVAFVGAGSISEMHGRGVSSCRQAQYIGVFDPDPSRAKAHAAKFGGKAYGRFEQILEDPQVEAVHVLSPQECHVSQALASLKAGKHVLVEKPVAHEISQIEILVEAAADAGRICVPGHNYVHSPAIRRARRMIDSGRLGDVYGFWMLYNVYHSEEVASRYGGILRAVCVHHAYSLLYLLGRPEQITAMTSCVHYEDLDCEDSTSMMCRMPGGAIAHLWASFAGDDPTSDPWTINYKVLGTKGGVSFSWGEARCEDTTAPCWDMVAYEESVVCEIDYFINHCVIGGEAPLSSLQDAIDALRIVEAAEQAAAGTGSSVLMSY